MCFRIEQICPFGWGIRWLSNEIMPRQILSTKENFKPVVLNWLGNGGNFPKLRVTIIFWGKRARSLLSFIS